MEVDSQPDDQVAVPKHQMLLPVSEDLVDGPLAVAPAPIVAKRRVTILQTTNHPRQEVLGSHFIIRLSDPEGRFGGEIANVPPIFGYIPRSHGDSTAVELVD
jgi:hypothetical protein